VDLVGVAEAAQMLGVSRQRVHELARVHVEFPEPLAELSAGRIWQRSDIEQWMASRGRPERGFEMTEVAGVVVVSPVKFGDMQAMGDTIRGARPVAVNMRRLEKSDARRCADFMSGAGYVAGGEVERLAERVFLVSPAGTTVTKSQRKAIIASVS
jgi:FtsZ-interacting cell division protein YlmF